MLHNDLTFFTNEPDRNLYERFSNILKSNTKFFDVLVGYFRTSGFFKMYEAMESVEKIRILVGLNVDKYTVKIIDKVNMELNYDFPTIKQATEVFGASVEDEFEKTEPTLQIEQGVRTFVDWLKNGKMEMRMYMEAPIHAKVYIMRKDMDKVPDTFGSVITGSSNFSEAGLQNNLEFNVELKDSRDVQFALDKFEELWEKGVEVSKDYIEAVEQNTWLRNDITPYQIYLKTLYEFFKEEINADKDLLADKLLPEGYMQLQYQLDAVVQAKKILETYNGVFISDVVGLGKTYICAMLAKSLKKGRKLVICPPVLVDYWNEVLQEFDVAAEVQSLGKLDRILEKGVDKYTYVFIDEAHRFRNQGTESFSSLHKICYGKKVVLISATPINNYSSDIENQIYLFQPKHNSNIIGLKDLEYFFRELRSKEKKIEKGTRKYFEQIRANSEEIRDKILRHIMIRRTRSEIVEYYGADMERQGLKFPKLGTPEPIAYVFDDETNILFNETVEAIKNFKYSRYKPLTYLKKTTQEQNKMMTAQHNMGGFMKSILVKRLESSFFAFRNTLGRFLESYEKFIAMYEQGEVYISKKVDVYDLLDSGDDDKLMELVEAEAVMHFQSKEFNSQFVKDLQMDLNMLKQLDNKWQKMTDDPKLIQFKAELKKNKKLKNNKKIIFTESKETAEYLAKELSDMYGERVIAYTGSSSMILKSVIEDSFNPKYTEKGKDQFDVLITTDVLAEGINLHRANALINYDLPWNPTRIMQRVGRINRVGSEYEEIYVFNFFPTAVTSKHLPLKDRIIEKLQAFHDTLGEDFKYLSDEEEVSSQKLFQDLNKDLSEDEEGSNPELAYLATIRQIRDNDMTLFEKIKRLPKKAKTGKISSKVSDEATLSFIRKGYLKTFFVTEKGETKQISFLDAVDYLKCEPDEQRISVGKKYFEHYDSNNEAFDISLTEEEVIAMGRIAVGANDQKVIRYLRALLMSVKTFTDDQEEKIKRMIEVWENGDVPAADTKNILKAIKNIEDGVEAYYKIVEIMDEKYLEGRRQIKFRQDGEKQVILSCYMKEEQYE
ncbi:MAG: phospholipase D-like domain-containing protein [Clostridium sp.]|nr:phospholipase D-like domain-containing protein [Clostridium sp.]MCM1460586.1 phospholipase D-like domain-containing protein [Bacteroides sp.]